MLGQTNEWLEPFKKQLDPILMTHKSGAVAVTKV